MAQAWQKVQADLHHRDIKYAVGDQVLLSSKNLPLADTKKFCSQFVALVGPVTMCLALTGKLRGLHPVFYVSLLHRYEPGGDGVEPPPSIVVDEEEDYKVEALLAHRVQ